VVHGCLLEGMALALEHRYEPFSQGRGFITPDRVDEIMNIAVCHGIFLAPLYNAERPLVNAPVGLFPCCRQGVVNNMTHAAKINNADHPLS
jgi:hypothetical protein